MGEAPLVSCIMPTHARPLFAAEAVRGFLAQDYGPRELVIVDDGERPMPAAQFDDERIRYYRLPGRPSLGEKRNFACARARGDLIAHVDDDDIYPRSRLTTQVGALVESGASICGTSRLYFFDLLHDRAFLYAYPRGGWLAGATLVYRRSHWQKHRFRPVGVGEDWAFVRTAQGPGATLDLADPDLCVSTIHGKNASPRSPDDHWSEIDTRDLARRLGSSLDGYRRAASA